MFRNNGLVLKVLLVVSLFITSCLTPSSSEGSSQKCPTWVSYGNILCDVKLFKTNITSSQVLEMTEWDVMRVTIVGGDLVVKDSTNIIVHNDAGELVDHSTEILVPGTYLFEKVDETAETEFNFVSVDTSIIVSISAEFIRPTK